MRTFLIDSNQPEKYTVLKFGLSQPQRSEKKVLMTKEWILNCERNRGGMHFLRLLYSFFFGVGGNWLSAIRF